MSGVDVQDPGGAGRQEGFCGDDGPLPGNHHGGLPGGEVAGAVYPDGDEGVCSADVEFCCTKPGRPRERRGLFVFWREFEKIHRIDMNLPKIDDILKNTKLNYSIL